MKIKRILLVLMILCCTVAGCRDRVENKAEAVSSQYYALKYVGQFSNKVSLYQTGDGSLRIEKEQGESFDVYSLDIDSGGLRFEYTIPPQGNLLYSKQLAREQILKVKQLGNGEENNMMVLEGKKSKEIAAQIAYSRNAVVDVSPAGRYIVFCRAEGVSGSYGLYAYDLKNSKLLPLMNSVEAEVLNDFTYQLCWSKDESRLLVSSRYVFDMTSGKLTAELHGIYGAWSEDGSQLAYVKQEGGIGKSICIFTVAGAQTKEVFVVNPGESLTQDLIWNKEGTYLAFLTAETGNKALQSGIHPYKAVYSLSLKNNKAKRMDQVLALSPDFVARIDSLHYNASGSLLALSMATFTGNQLFICQTDSGNYDFFMNVEYLHDENGEDYVCSLGDKMYFVRGDKVIETDEALSSRSIYKSERPLEDLYGAEASSSLLMVERWEKGTSLRRLRLKAE